ncbi:NADH-quinone oxidoreductase subunit L [uncultured Arcticibacterium sp.]|uniref:NADH-quinone oxidoreductase subunit 5 family protein n=1 Tax=uncultured Arcticibacterium sp. TaxID=2173042 RepID=UPI0030FBFBCF
MPTDQLIFLTLSLYLLGFAGLLSFRNTFSKTIASALSIGINLVGLIIAIVLLSRFKDTELFEFTWVSFVNSSLAASLLINKLTLLMWALVQFIALLVQLFSDKYMADDDRFNLYYAYLNMFVFSMLGLVCSGNLLFIFIFWELVGFSSYLLIGFWYKKQSAINASLKAFVMNRIGDAGFLIGIGLVYFQFETLELDALSTIVYEPSSILTLTGLMLFGGCVGKSAQFPLQVWLPDAMEGPTPVSALIHAATMVAAGIFLLARVDFIFTPTAGQVIAFTGALTAILAAYSAVFQSDIKKVLAYSTVSQLGLMVMAMGAGATNAALFHLFTHAFFKAGLFLIAGAVIHHFHHEQNMFKMGGLFAKKTLLAVLFIICGASLSGLPLFSGFLSKDAILLSTWNWAETQNSTLLIVPILGILASVLTGYYMMRAFVLVFLKRGNSQEHHTTKSRLSIFEWSILPLALLSFWFAFGNSPLNFEENRFTSHFPIPHQNNHWLGYLVLALAVLAIALSYFKTKKEAALETQTLNFWSKLGLNHFYIDWFYLNKVAKPLAGQLHDFAHEESLHPSGTLHNMKGFAKLIYRFDQLVVDGGINLLSKAFAGFGTLIYAIDKKVVDGGVKMIYTYVDRVGNRLKTIQGGKIQSYLIALILFFLAIMIFLNLL